MTNLTTVSQMSKRKVFETTLQINDCNSFPLMVKAQISAECEDGGWSFDVLSLICVELHIAGRGIEITGDVRSNPRMKEMVINHVLLQETDLYNEVANLEEVAHD